MSKCKIALLAGILLGLSVLTGCPGPNQTPVEEKVRITVELGNYAVLSNTDYSSFYAEVKKNTIITKPDVVIKPAYEGQIVITKWINKDTEEEYFFNTPITSDITLTVKYKAADVLDFYVRQTTNQLNVSWTTVQNSTYVAKWWEGDATSSLTVNSESSPFIIDTSTKTNGQKYTIQVQRFPTILYPDVDSTTSVITKTVTISDHTEWLMLMYMDGDNNLNDPIYLDLNEAEYGLSQLPEGSSVRILALWDGWDFKSGNDDDKTSAFYDINTEATRLLELGPDERTLFSPNGGAFFEACQLSTSTTDLTSTVDWIEDNEVNMANPETLKNFLNWATNNYSADHIILQFSNHGGGPRSAATGEEYGRRSMCWDETNGGSSFIKTSDVSKALKSAGYGAGVKVDLIMEDVCLGGSLEEAYELKDYAKYYVGSPNNVPGSGFDYISFVSSLTNGAPVEQVGCNLVKTYKSNYTWTDTKWNSYLTDNPDLADEDDMWISISNPDANTLSFIDLEQIGAVKNAVSELANLIYSDKGGENRIKVDTNTNKLYFIDNHGNYYDNQDNPPPANANLSPVNRKFAIKWWTAYYGDPIYYTGSFGCLKDLGAMCAFMRKYYPESLWPELYAKTNAVTSALSNAIVASWRDGYNNPTYYKNPIDNIYQDALVYPTGIDIDENHTELGAGLTINCSCWVPYIGNDGKTYKYQGFANWYKNELAFGKDCTNWTTLIDYWWGN